MIRVGEKLKEERKKMGLTIEQVAKSTRIRPEFLRAIEEGAYEKLPGSSYAHGFVKNYIEFVGLPLREYMALFRREYDEKEHRGVLPESFVGKEKITLRKFTISQALLLAGAVILLIIGYLIFQYRASFLSPELNITKPLENEKISSQTVLISGNTDPNTAVTVNDLPAYVDASGKFSKEIPVFPGNVVISVKAVNSFGKISTLQRHITVIVSQ